MEAIQQYLYLIGRRIKIEEYNYRIGKLKNIHTITDIRDGNGYVLIETKYKDSIWKDTEYKGVYSLNYYQMMKLTSRGKLSAPGEWYTIINS